MISSRISDLEKALDSFTKYGQSTPEGYHKVELQYNSALFELLSLRDQLIKKREELKADVKQIRITHRPCKVRECKEFHYADTKFIEAQINLLNEIIGK